MPFLFIGTTGDQAGQSLLAWAIARRLSEKGFAVGFYKPFGTNPIHMDNLWTDSDAFLFKNVLNLQDPLEMICPIVGPEHAIHQTDKNIIFKEIKNLAQEISMGKDMLIILGSKHIFFDDSPQPLPDVSLVSDLNADLVLIHRFKRVSTTLYSLLSVSSLLKGRIRGIVINRVPPEQISDVKEKILPVLNQQGMYSIAVLPEDPALGLKSIGEIGQLLDGQIICCEEFFDRRVAGMTVGTGELQGDLSLFKRVYNKIILLGMDDVNRTFETQNIPRPVAGIILTGDRKPADRVLETAKKSGIPLIIVKEDSFAAKERLEHSTPVLTPADEDKVVHFTELMGKEDSLNRIIQALGLGQN